ncbi:MAG: cytochrome c [Chloroflexi bacterium]|nr:cytochrome c [Chloroflexota bacterium]
MNRDLMKLVGSMLVGGVAILVLLSGCGSSASGTALPTATAPAGATARLEPSTTAPASSQSAVPSPTPAPSAGSGVVLEKGKLIFEKTAGGVGCASCHGLDGKGKSGPFIQGASKARVQQFLAGGQAMSFIKLSDEEITAVVAYLQYLSKQP